MVLALVAGASLTVLSPRVMAVDASFGLLGSYLAGEDLGDGYGGGIRLKYDLFEYLAMDYRASFLYYQDPSANVFPLEFNLIGQFPIANIVLPYAGMGVGYYFFNGGDLDLSSCVGYGPVGGVEVRVTPSFAIFGEARYLFLEPQAWALPGNPNLEAGGFGINAGVMFLF